MYLPSSLQMVPIGARGHTKVTSVLGFLGALFCGWLLAAVPAMRAATAAVSADAPAEAPWLANVSANTSGAQVRNMSVKEGGARFAGVGFVAPATANLKKITFFVTKAGSGISGVKVKISLVKLAGRTAAPEVPYKEIASEEVTLPDALTVPGCLTFDLDKPWALTGGEAYGVVVSFPEAASSRRINFATSTGSPGVGSTFLSSDAGATYETVNPLKFVLQIASESPKK